MGISILMALYALMLVVLGVATRTVINRVLEPGMLMATVVGEAVPERHLGAQPHFSNHLVPGPGRGAAVGVVSVFAIQAGDREIVER